MAKGIYKRTSEMKTGKHIRTNEMREKMSLIQKGKKLRLGTHFSEESKIKLSLSQFFSFLY